MVDNNTNMTARSLAAFAASLISLGACTVKDPLFCDETHPCSDPSRPYCDLTGEYQSDHIGRTCIASPFDAMPDAPPADAMPEQAMLSINEPTHDFHDVQVGSDSLPAQFVVTNNGQVPSGAIATSIDGTNPAAFAIIPTGDANDCSGRKLAGGDTCIVQVRYHADVSGPESAVLHVDASPGGMKIVGLSGNGLVPGSLEVTAGATLTFADTRIQSIAAAKTITVHNKGGVPCTNLGVTLNDATNYTKTSTTCGTNLAANASCDVSVQFNPATVGAHPSSVTITSDQGAVAPQLQGTGTGDVTVSKVGTGSIADTLSTPIISCGSTCSGTYAQTPITLHATTSGGIPFNNWGGGCASAGSNASCTLGLTQAITSVSANFGVCAPGTGMCTNGSLQTCDSTGHWGTPTTCALGCFTDGTRCWDVDPTNGLSAALDDARNQPTFSLADGAEFDTSAGTVVDAVGNPYAIKTMLIDQGSNAPKIRVYEVGSITMGAAKVVGTNAFAIVSDRDIVITGIVNAVGAYDANGNPSSPGAGGGPGAACAGATVTSPGNDYQGTGGGSFAGAGARGGNNPPNMGGAAGSTVNAPTLVPLRGGCSGGVNASSVAYPGLGGGAVQLVSRTQIKINSNGVVNVGGGGGGPVPPNNPQGGGGGGAGGGVLLEAPSILVSGATAGLAANGGGGGANCVTGAGEAGRPSTTAAKAGVCTGTNVTNGGDGAATFSATQGVDFSTTHVSGQAGGGGGGVGFIRLNTVSGGSTFLGGAFMSGSVSVGNIGKR